MEDFKARQRTMWALGDYPTLSEYVAEMGELVVDRASVDESMHVLDVACGSGNAAFAAARAGAQVTGLDLVPELLAAGAKKAEAAGLQVQWVEGDAEDLPFEDDSFDRVFSTIGHMFAPRHQQTADEMARVCREGGVIAFTAWTPEGTVGDIFRAAASYLPPPPDFAQPPVLWGSEDHVREVFGSVATDFAFERHVNRLEWESVEGFADFFMERFGPLVMAQQVLGDRFGDLRQKIVGIWSEKNEADDETLSLPQEYLLAVVEL